MLKQENRRVRAQRGPSRIFRVRYPWSVAEIVLTTLNAKYAHSAFGLRYLRANLGELRERSVILEFDIGQRTTDVLERILAENPRVVGLGVYIWNAAQSEQLATELKRVRPEITLVIGGPEVSYEVEAQRVCAIADYVITGEADEAFAKAAQQILAGRKPLLKVIQAELPEMERIALPYGEYTDRDIRERVIYVEASRGCPFKCEFCLSSLDVPVRNAPTEEFLAEIGTLLARGARHLKFVDRTFNLNLGISTRILQYLRERWEPGMFFHFEMIPDRLPEALKKAIACFPAGALQLEVGIQTFNEAAAERISRKQDQEKVEQNLRYLREETGVHIHADLIVGLPGEDMESFARGFDRLVGLKPQEIQVGMLKRLRGTPIVRHDEAWGMKYSGHAPYEVLETGAIPFEQMQRLRRFARHWDLIANSGNFVESVRMIWREGTSEEGSPFWSFLALSEWIHQQEGRSHGIALTRLAEMVMRWLTEPETRRAVTGGSERCAGTHNDRAAVAETLLRDYQRGGRSDVPKGLREWVRSESVVRRTIAPSGAPKRQARHAASGRGTKGSATVHHTPEAADE